MNMDMDTNMDVKATGLVDLLETLRDVILAERAAARSLHVDEMIELTGEKEQLLETILPMVGPAADLSPREEELARSVYAENLRNAWFFWSALKWTRESLDFMGRAVWPASYADDGSLSKNRHSGSIISGKI